MIIHALYIYICSVCNYWYVDVLFLNDICIFYVTICMYT